MAYDTNKDKLLDYKEFCDIVFGRVGEERPATASSTGDRYLKFAIALP